MSNPSPYTEEQKAEALVLYRTQGPSAAQRVLGISNQLICHWALEAGVVMDAPDIGALRRTNIWLERSQELLAQLTAGSFEAADSVRSAFDAGDRLGAERAMKALALMIDRAQLISGAATTRSESMVAHMTVEQARAERDRILADAERRRQVIEPAGALGQ